MTPSPAGRRVVVVTGAGNGIGAAVATELGRLGDHVVTVDPMVSVDGTASLPPPEATTAGAIAAAGGSAESSSISVTDREAVLDLFAQLVGTHGRVDAVVNVAGITRPTGFARGGEDDWAAVLAVHLDGYRNVLDAALTHMVPAGSGHVLGVTSGSGWRAADAGAYSCAKRAVAALTWQLGRAVPSGVTVNAISPIAMTRMVTAALGRRAAAPASTSSSGRSTGGLALAAMPDPADLAPLAAHLVGHGGTSLRGSVLFAGGSEVASVDPPRLLEVVRTSGVRSVDSVVHACIDTLAAAEAAQSTTGGANPRLGTLFDDDARSDPAATGTKALVVTDHPALGNAVAVRLDADGTHTRTEALPDGAVGFDDARRMLSGSGADGGGPDVVVVARRAATRTDATWEGVLDDHAHAVPALLEDAAWVRAVADLAAESGRPVRLVTLTDARAAGGQSRAQAAAQLARSSLGATSSLVAAFAVALETDGDHQVVAALTAALAQGDQSLGLAGAELVVGDGWLGLRSHPRPGGSIVFGGPELPRWFDDVVHREQR